MKTEKNRYLPNGHNWQRPNLPCYLPGNGGLLYAVAMMAAGWQGAPARTRPVFPVMDRGKSRRKTLMRKFSGRCRFGDVRSKDFTAHPRQS